MYINKTKVDELLKKFYGKQNIWEFADNKLYSICQEHPDHKNIEQVIAKLWFIGRTYAAALERRRNAKVSTDELYENAAKAMSEFLDDKLRDIKNNPTAFANTLELHNELAHSFIVEAEKDNATIKRSLASKYLHFHCPDKFYIYDSNAASAISLLVSKQKKSDWSKIDISEYEKNIPCNVDAVYCDFCLKALALHKYLADKNLTIKKLDEFLLFVKNYND